jgi:hypothetical protein
MSTEVDESLVRELAEPLVAEFSPAEQGELYELLSEAHFADPTAFTRQDRAYGPLAFGLPELTVLLTPVLLAAVDEAVRYVVTKAFERGMRVTTTAIRRLLKRTEPADDTALVLTSEQWTELRQIVERVAIAGGVPQVQAGLIADAVVGQGRTRGA